MDFRKKINSEMLINLNCEKNLNFLMINLFLKNFQIKKFQKREKILGD